MNDKTARGQSAMPLVEAMRAYAASGAVPFHTPGHKQGRGLPEAMREWITSAGARAEVSLMAQLDDLHAPESCIKEAQELAAALYGADATQFFVNGTTGAIHAMLLAALRPGDMVLIPRNAHRSILGGVMLVGARPVFMQPEIDRALGIAMNVAPETVAAALTAHPQARAVVLINPTYYGVACDLRRIAALVHGCGALLLVDEAHGPHLKFNAALPVPALDAGADLVAQSTHKMLGSLTQTSLLHVRFGRVDGGRVRMMSGLVQSTSPNYLLLASLDAARWQMAEQGAALVARAAHLADWARREINALPGLVCFGAERLGGPGAYALDPTKLTVTTTGLGLDGAAAERILWREHRIQAELADARNVLFIVSFADGAAEVKRLVEALRALAARFAGREVAADENSQPLPPLPEQRLSPREALFAGTCAVDFPAAADRVAAEMITFYPPGIPVICPGEVLTPEVIAYCSEMLALGLKVVGPEDTKLKTIKVVK